MESIYIRVKDGLPSDKRCKCGNRESKDGTVFLFCKECDGLIPLEERWEALDGWKGSSVAGL